MSELNIPPPQTAPAAPPSASTSSLSVSTHSVVNSTPTLSPLSRADDPLAKPLTCFKCLKPLCVHESLSKLTLKEYLELIGEKLFSHETF